MAKKQSPASSRRKEGSGRVGKARGLLIRVNDDGLKAIRVLAAERDTSIQALGLEAWNDLLSKYGRHPALKNPLVGQS